MHQACICIDDGSVYDLWIHIHSVSVIPKFVDLRHAFNTGSVAVVVIVVAALVAVVALPLLLPILCYIAFVAAVHSGSLLSSVAAVICHCLLLLLFDFVCDC